MQYIPPIGKMGEAPYIDGDPAQDIEGDAVSAKAWEHPMREIVQVINDAGLTPDGANLAQLSAAVMAISRSSIGTPTAVAAGTPDAITANFTPAAILVDGVTLLVRAAAANATATPTLAVDGSPAKPIIKGSNQPLAAGDIVGGGHWLEFQYDQALDKFALQNPATGVTSQVQVAIVGQSKNLKASATGLSANISVTADQIILSDGADYLSLGPISLAVDGSSAGANGLDTGALAVNSWYSLWVIWNGLATAGLLSLSATAPTLPAGYTHKARVGWIRTDGTANKFPLSFRQAGKKVQWWPLTGTNLTTNIEILNSGTATIITPVAISGAVPSTVAAVSLLGFAFGIVSTYGEIYSSPSSPIGHPSATLTSINNGTVTGSFSTIIHAPDYAAGIAYSIVDPGGMSIYVTGWEDAL